MFEKQNSITQIHKLHFMRDHLVRGVFFITLLVIFSCDEDEKLTNPNTGDECVTMRSENNGNIIKGEFIVAFNHDTYTGGRSSATAARTLQNHGIPADRITDKVEGEFSNYFIKLSDAEAEILKTDPAVVRIEPDRVISICACLTVIEPRLVTWNAETVGYGNGIGKTAWIMDTGIDFDHPDLTVDQTKSRSFVDGVVSGDDDNGHGTHIAGIIGAKNNDIGTLGIASGASLVSLKILDNKGEGKLSTALKGLSYLRSNGKAGDVANISLSLEEVSEILETEIAGIANRGIYFTIAAGNQNKPARNYSPAHASGVNIYTVSAVDSLNVFASFSNYGNDVIDYAAPGVRILSSYKDGQYAIMSGTSMASPHVAGLLLINKGKINSKGFATGDPDGEPDPIAHQ